MFDGRYGQVICNGCFFVYTVKASYLPYPPLQECKLQLMRDCHFSRYDPVLWPQLFTELFPHHAVIKNPPSNPSDHSLRWWWLPECQDIVFSLSTHIEILQSLSCCLFEYYMIGLTATVNMSSVLDMSPTPPPFLAVI